MHGPRDTIDYCRERLRLCWAEFSWRRYSLFRQELIRRPLVILLDGLVLQQEHQIGLIVRPGVLRPSRFGCRVGEVVQGAWRKIEAGVQGCRIGSSGCNAPVGDVTPRP